MAVLPRGFYERPAREVAADLLGKILRHGAAAGRIVEVEAYLGEHDPAAHAAAGRTARTDVLYGEAGHAYVYLIYGRYECLNVVAEPRGSPGCVLIRAVEPVAGLAAMRRRRGVWPPEQLASGPGKLTVALGIGRRHNGCDLTGSALRIEDAPPPAEPVRASPRVGIRRAADWPLRFFLEGNPHVSPGPKAVSRA
jgi:DNA-3-methyladenine glycosylase